MKKNILFLFLITLSNYYGISQSNDCIDRLPYIEVTGKAEKKIIPDEIYLSINLEERLSGRDKITVPQQENDLKNVLLEMKIPLENLYLSGSSSDYQRLGWGEKGVVSKAGYELKLKNALEVEKVFEKLDELKINNSYISKVSHSRLEELKKEIQVSAIRAAKEKANRLLTSIGHRVKKPLLVRENSYYIDDYNMPNRRSGMVMAESLSNNAPQVIMPVDFKKIVLSSSIYVKFEIE